MTILDAINRHMNGGECPNGSSLGECAAISPMVACSGHQYFVASLYLWPAADSLRASEVAGWFKQIGCTDVVVSAILHDADNDTYDGLSHDGVRPWEVSFFVDDAATRELLGL